MMSIPVITSFPPAFFEKDICFVVTDRFLNFRPQLSSAGRVKSFAVQQHDEMSRLRKKQTQVH